MSDPIAPKTFKPFWTVAGFRAGVVATLPLMPGMFAFGMAFGTVAARKGFSLFAVVVHMAFPILPGTG